MKGYVDRFDTTIAGWAFDPQLPNQPVEITISHGSEELYRCTADLFRSDLVPVAGSGNHGFSFDPQNINGFNRNMVLTVRAHGTDVILLKEDNWAYKSVVAEGSDGWLFLQNDSNYVNERMAGLVANETSRINETAMTFVARSAILEKLGIAYCSIIVPEKNVVCAQYWTEMQVSEVRPVPRIIAQANMFGCEILYPITEFLRDPSKFFLKTDTHLTADGYDHLLTMLTKRLPSFFDGASHVSRERNPNFCGDLGVKLSPPCTESVDEFVFPSNPGQIIAIDQVNEAFSANRSLRGSVIYVTNDIPTKRRLLIHGTSTGFHFLPCIAQYFSETLFIWENTFDYQLIREFRPDCVVWLAAERFLPTGCNDMFGLPETMTYLCENTELLNR